MARKIVMGTGKLGHQMERLLWPNFPDANCGTTIIFIQEIDLTKNPTQAEETTVVENIPVQ